MKKSPATPTSPKKRPKTARKPPESEAKWWVPLKDYQALSDKYLALTQELTTVKNLNRLLSDKLLYQKPQATQATAEQRLILLIGISIILVGLGLCAMARLGLF